jgi:peptidoglycan hydrolase-like amidase
MLRFEAEKIGGEFSSLAESKAELDREKDDLDKQREGLNQAHELLANEKARLQAELSKQVADRGAITKRIESLETQISHLLEEQKEAARREAALLSAPPPPQSSTPPEIPPGGFYISGRGRDLSQGHGVGMSQWGAYGGAKKGMSAEDILKFYYTGVQITSGYENRTINVEGYGPMNIEEYVAGFGSWAGAQGEVPAKACGTTEQAQQYPEKYTTNSGCWPEEAIKAQAIAYRTYGLNYVSGGSAICATPSCQVYNGQNHTAWAAEETKGMVLTYRGSLISAVYSSDNSQGAGTANNETVWQNFEGKGYPKDYLRAVNDSSFAQSTRWTHWVYQTRCYTYDDVLRMLKSQTSKYPMINNAKRIEKIQFERDPSGRVARMFFYFDTSTDSQAIGGWWFKNMWNTWQGGLGGTPDYIYSQTFYFLFE